MICQRMQLQLRDLINLWINVRDVREITAKDHLKNQLIVSKRMLNIK